MRKEQILTIAAAVAIVFLIQYRQGLFNLVRNLSRGPQVGNPNPNEYRRAIGPNVQKPYWDEV